MSADRLGHVGIFQRLLRVKPYFDSTPGTWALVALSAIVAAITEPLIPALLKPLLDSGFQRGELPIWVVPASLLLLFSVRGIAGYVTQIGLTKITHTGLQSIRIAMFQRLTLAKLDIFVKNSASALTNTIVYEIQTGSGMLVGSLLSLTRNGLTLVALTSYLIYLNWKLTLIVAAVFPAVAYVMRVLSTRLHKLTKANQDATDELAYVVEENVLAFREVRLHGAQTQQLERFQLLSQVLQGLAMRSTVAGAAMTPLTQMLAAVALSAVISVALIQSASSGTTVGSFVAFVTAMLMIVAPMRQLSEISSPITKGLAALERGIDLIATFPNEEGGSFGVDRARGEIVFQKAEVCYIPGAPAALKSISLHVEPGETVALVGASGSGKSTLVNTLTRFVELSNGEVLLDGTDIRQWSIAALRQQFSYVSQNVVMFSDTIANNIAFGRSVDEARLWSCLSAADLEVWVKTQPMGLQTRLGHNAADMSGGQRQRLAIARALYRDAPILILDEATSALDTESERAVQDALRNLMKGRTTLIVAHRLSTIQHAARIVVLDAGNILEVGNHKTLLELDGHYAKLYKLGAQAPEVID
ncbi:MAG: lipid A export permease/ATP-binding protein MsbA [Undibacterium sp.]|uniref:lipid A export permease/ATP-binding protein MsbA n=1 Tax=Undibacterium sp. TaxID=1914977 RepID=UPI0027235175|nr:lipid A export permease/ATP-binding protein MsbA [Undibacterium sp.]MDO8651966.1 lipid A export permease/ATP-binding protein MsbA [Undibacterium sp.]